MDKPIPHIFAPVEIVKDSRLTLRQTRILLALYYFRGDDTGLVWPKRKTLSKLTGLAETRISTITTELEKLGWLKKEGKGGFSKATTYTLTVPKSVTVTESVTVTKTVTSTVTESVTRKEDTIEDTNKKKGGVVDLCPDFISKQSWIDFVNHRKNLGKAKALTETQANKILKRLSKLYQEGFDVDDLLDVTVENGWQGIFPNKAKKRNTAKPLQPKTSPIDFDSTAWADDLNLDGV